MTITGELSVNEAEMKVEALRAANQAVSTAVHCGNSLASMGRSVQNVKTGDVLEEAKRIYAWLSEKAVNAPA